jgi:hypothetical protein
MAQHDDTTYGRIQREHVEALTARMKDGGPRIALDLNEVSLVELDVVFFLAIGQREGVELLHCSCYWIAEEQTERQINFEEN